ncbi:hypothetical protein KUTeg_009666 [Tegillarca granosa]|uniref:Uncharacterized protein n=1 Tax=Tegillarca granosa TaxID=220873 RepID=A0ABQ9F4I9_TEGGR|nr:hypothetical protein KUTeg_009666 [Tegillarca granosa]
MVISCTSTQIVRNLSSWLDTALEITKDLKSTRNETCEPRARTVILTVIVHHLMKRNLAGQLDTEENHQQAQNLLQMLKQAIHQNPQSQRETQENLCHLAYQEERLTHQTALEVLQVKANPEVIHPQKDKILMNHHHIPEIHHQNKTEGHTHLGQGHILKRGQDQGQTLDQNPEVKTEKVSAISEEWPNIDIIFVPMVTGEVGVIAIPLQEAGADTEVTVDTVEVVAEEKVLQGVQADHLDIEIPEVPPLDVERVHLVT